MSTLCDMRYFWVVVTAAIAVGVFVLTVGYYPDSQVLFGVLILALPVSGALTWWSFLPEHERRGWINQLRRRS